MKKILISPILLLVLACSQKPASIVYKGSRRYSKDYYENNKDDIARSTQNDYAESPDGRLVRKLRGTGRVVVEDRQELDEDNLREIEIKEGDTLFGIAERNNVSSKEIIRANNLQAPYLIKAGQKLKIPQNQYHIVQDGENLYSISRKYDINLNSLVSANDIEKPYIIRKGDKIKLPSSVSSYSIAKVSQIDRNNLSSSRNSPQQNKKVSLPSFKRNSFVWPAKGRVISRFGAKDGGLYNDGINIAMPEGAPFRATEDGVVAYVGNELRGYGNLIIIKHAGNWVSAYAHCQKTLVKRGDKIKKGEVIGYIGSTGNVKTPQLYFSLRKGRKSINPEDKLI